MRVRTVVGALAFTGIGVGLWYAATSPPDTLQGDFVRLMYVHVPSSWLAFLAFGVTLGASIGWLVRKRPIWDDVAASSAEIGVMFTALSLLTGSLWGAEVWGVAWDWGDARLASTAIMFFVYIGYLALRKAITDPAVRADRSAVVGIAAFAMIPIVYFSVNLFRTLHQTQSIRPGEWTMPAELAIPLLVNVGVFTLIYLYLLLQRLALARAERTSSTAGDTIVSAPDLDRIING